MPPATALLVTADETLLDDLLRLAAASGAALDVAHDTGSALRSWSGPAVVLVGVDQATPLAGRRPPRRDQVHVVGHAPLADGVFRSALGVGAQNVVELPAGEGWLVELLTDAADGAAVAALTIGVVGGSGGSGATTLACAVGVVAAWRTPAVLVDLDPLGPGADRVVGLEDTAGIRWDALFESAGRLGARSLRQALPHLQDLAVLTWGPAGSRTLEPSVVGEVLSAAQRGHGLVVLDLPRQSHDSADHALTRCDDVVLLAGLSLPAVASAARVADRLRQTTPNVHLVARAGGSGSLDPRRVADMLGLPLLATVADQRRLAEHVDLGLGPVHSRRGPLARAARDVLGGLTGSAVPPR
jgi:secretion/DNA translocation related CpaE-like protein